MSFGIPWLREREKTYTFRAIHATAQTRIVTMEEYLGGRAAWQGAIGGRTPPGNLRSEGDRRLTIWYTKYIMP